MGFLDRLFGRKKQEPKDEGIYFYVRCDNCERVLHTRLDPKTQLVRTNDGFSVHKDLRDDRCFRHLILTATFDRGLNVTSSDMTGGTIISRETWLAEKDLPRRPPSVTPEEETDL